MGPRGGWQHLCASCAARWSIWRAYDAAAALCSCCSVATTDNRKASLTDSMIMTNSGLGDCKEVCYMLALLLDVTLAYT